MKNRIIFFFLLLCLNFCKSVNGQNSGFYYKYDFKSYLLSKTQNSEKYLQGLQETIRYMAIARENKIEGKLEFLLINNGNNQSEIIVKKHGLKSGIENFNDIYLPYVGFEREVQLAFKKVDAELLIENKEKFMTEFSILFEMESSNSFSEEERNVDLIVEGKQVKMIMKNSH
ncbi:MAG: hypothetical protein NXI08_16665 [bacterium]|nr:hypothetical protein [bacterium]